MAWTTVGRSKRPGDRRALSTRDHLGGDLHSFPIVEYDPLLSEDAERRVVEYMTQDLKRTLQGATILKLRTRA
jgi:hypothetical protein